VVATSGRAIAQGLKTLGHSVVVIDGFADCDTLAATSECVKVARADFGLIADEVLQAVHSLQTRISFDGLFYDAALEANSFLLDKISIEPVYGNSRQTIDICKNSKTFFSLLDQNSIPYPEISFQFNADAHNKDVWLIKHAKGTGGTGVIPVSEEVNLTKNLYLQKKIDGLNFSLTFLANSNDIFALGFNTLWSEKLNNRLPYIYAGAINYVAFGKDVQDSAFEYAKAITKDLQLVGLNSIDFIYTNGSIYVLEVNPRIPATYELYESKHGDLMQQHIEACKNQTLPTSKKQALLRAHAIVYAPKDFTVPEKMLWPLWTADRPHANEIIQKNEPICSVFAGGQNPAQVREMIKTRKKSILAKLT
jgi:predicted ATP-grasp superfamily ATP-dependent carboligase